MAAKAAKIAEGVAWHLVAKKTSVKHHAEEMAKEKRRRKASVWHQRRVAQRQALRR
jgi:hypothetical protein